MLATLASVAWFAVTHVAIHQIHTNTSIFTWVNSTVIDVNFTSSAYTENKKSDKDKAVSQINISQ